MAAPDPSRRLPTRDRHSTHPISPPGVLPRHRTRRVSDGTNGRRPGLQLRGDVVRLYGAPHPLDLVLDVVPRHVVAGIGWLGGAPPVSACLLHREATVHTGLPQ